MPSDDLPDWLAKDYESPHFSAWDDELQAITVLPKIHPHIGQPLSGEDERED